MIRLLLQNSKNLNWRYHKTRNLLPDWASNWNYQSLKHWKSSRTDWSEGSLAFMSPHPPRSVKNNKVYWIKQASYCPESATRTVPVSFHNNIFLREYFSFSGFFTHHWTILEIVNIVFLTQLLYNYQSNYIVYCHQIVIAQQLYNHINSNAGCRAAIFYVLSFWCSMCGDLQRSL